MSELFAVNLKNRIKLQENRLSCLNETHSKLEKEQEKVEENLYSLQNSLDENKQKLKIIIEYESEKNFHNMRCPFCHTTNPFWTVDRKDVISGEILGASCPCIKCKKQISFDKIDHEYVVTKGWLDI